MVLSHHTSVLEPVLARVADEEEGGHKSRQSDLTRPSLPINQDVPGADVTVNYLLKSPCDWHDWELMAAAQRFMALSGRQTVLKTGKRMFHHLDRDRCRSVY